jgi:hypothetical protein
MAFSIGGVLGSASSVGSAINTLFGGPGGVRIGDITLAGVEIPEKLEWGGKQHLAKFVQPGGVVNLFPLGISYHPISWRGYFSGADALTRSRSLYSMMVNASVVKMSWNDRMYSVIVSRYTASDTQPNWIPYQITVEILRDETLFGYKPKPSLLSQITGDISSALGITPATMATVQSALSQAQVVAQAVGAVIPGSSAALALTGALNGAQGVVSGLTSVANGNIGGLISAASGLSAAFPPGNAASGATNVNTALSAASSLAVLATVKGQIGRAQTNLKNAST